MVRTGWWLTQDGTHSPLWISHIPLIWHFQKFLPRLEVFSSVTSGVRTDALSFSWVMWTLLNPLSYYNGFKRFNVHGSVHCRNIQIYIQQDEMLTVYYIWKLLYMFGWYLHPSSGVHTTVSTASDIYISPETCRAVSRYNKMCNVSHQAVPLSKGGISRSIPGTRTLL